VVAVSLMMGEKRHNQIHVHEAYRQVQHGPVQQIQEYST
jgi:hypothetical protein